MTDARRRADDRCRGGGRPGDVGEVEGAVVAALSAGSAILQRDSHDRAMPDTTPETITIFVKRYAAGKAFGCASGDPTFAEQASEALAHSLVMDIRIDRARFVALMRERGAPDLVIGRYLASAEITDEAWLQDVLPT